MNVPFLDGDVIRSTSNHVYISRLIRAARVSNHVDDFNTRIEIINFVKRFRNVIGVILT